MRSLQNTKQATPDALVTNIMTSVDLYRGGAPYRDDLTLLAFSLNDDESSSQVSEVEEI
jgi:serine phosphatase RsbU (regulator of sigma subunit)